MGLTTMIEIWLKWWTESNDGNANSNTAMFDGVYGAILCAWITFIGIDCW